MNRAPAVSRLESVYVQDTPVREIPQPNSRCRECAQVRLQLPLVYQILIIKSVCPDEIRRILDTIHDSLLANQILLQQSISQAHMISFLLPPFRIAWRVADVRTQSFENSAQVRGQTQLD